MPKGFLVQIISEDTVRNELAGHVPGDKGILCPYSTLAEISVGGEFSRAFSTKCPMVKLQVILTQRN